MKAQAKPDGNETVLFEQTLYPWCLFSCLFCCPGTSSIAIFLLTPRLQCGTASRPSVSTLHRAAAWGTWIALIFVVSRTWSLIATAVRCASTGILLHLLQHNMVLLYGHTVSNRAMSCCRTVLCHVVVPWLIANSAEEPSPSTPPTKHMSNSRLPASPPRSSLVCSNTRGTRRSFALWLSKCWLSKSALFQ